MSPRHYVLQCLGCGAAYEDDGFRLECSNEHAPALLCTTYDSGEFSPGAGADGIFRYKSWLPVGRELPGAGGTVTYRSERLCRQTGLPDLWVAFNGNWPEKGATLEAATFKQLEAYAVLSRLPEEHQGVIVVASAGNTGKAFAYSCSQAGVPCLIVVPACALREMRFASALAPCVKLVSLKCPADYTDAILLAGRVSRMKGFFAEGGVKNVARRDGIGTTALSAAETIGRLPDYYFQAIGSGTGGIAVHEMSKRLAADGRYGRKLPRLMLSQNLPFAPIYTSWKTRRRQLVEVNNHEAKRQVREVVAQVLTNRQPPYSVKGGVFDVLRESCGDMLAAENAEALHAMNLFRECEGIEIDPAAGVAFATLLKEAARGRIKRSDCVLLHITGGRCGRTARPESTPAPAALELGEGEWSAPETPERVAALFN